MVEDFHTTNLFIVKMLRNLGTYNYFHNCPRNGTVWFYNVEICSKGILNGKLCRSSSGMANSVDPDQTAPIGAV